MNEIIVLLLVAGIMLLFFGILGWIADLVTDKLGCEEEGKKKRPAERQLEQGGKDKYPSKG